jgi:hypothetical protein
VVGALVAELLAEGRHLAEERARGAVQPGPAEPDARLGLGRRTPRLASLPNSLLANLSATSSGT